MLTKKGFEQIQFGLGSTGFFTSCTVFFIHYNVLASAREMVGVAVLKKGRECEAVGRVEVGLANKACRGFVLNE